MAFGICTPVHYRLASKSACSRFRMTAQATAEVNVHKTTLSACTALHEIAAGVDDRKRTIRVTVDSVGALVRGQTIAATLYADIAPLVQDEMQARDDLMRRGASVLSKEEHSEEDVKEMDMLNLALENLGVLYSLSSSAYGRGTYRVVDDHPHERWVSVSIDVKEKTNMNVNVNEPKWDAAADERALIAVQQFVDEMIAEKRIRVCPYTASAHWAGVGGAGAGILPGAIRYVTSAANDCATLVSSTLKAGLEMLYSEPIEASTVLLLLPGSGIYSDFETFTHHAGYLTAVIEHCRLDHLIDIVLFHPQYNARLVHAALAGTGEQQTKTKKTRTYTNKGHLPPPEQVAALAVANRALCTDDNIAVPLFTPDALATAHNFARRAPVPVINILRSQHLNALTQAGTGDKSMLYVRNAQKLAQVGVQNLQSQLDQWVRFVHHA